MKALLPLAAFALLAFLRPWQQEEPSQPFARSRALATLVPERCAVFLEAPGAHALFEQGLDHPLAGVLRESPIGAFWLSTHPRAVDAALARAEEWLGTPVLPLLATVTARGLAFGFDPATKKSVLVAVGDDSAAVERALSATLDALERQFDAPGFLDRPNARWHGADVWWLGEDGVIARRDELVVLGNDRELLRESLKLAADPLAQGMSARPGFAEQRRVCPSDATLWAWLELAAIEPFGDDGYRALRTANRAPAVQGLFGAEIGALVSARALSFTLKASEEGLELHARAHEAARVDALVPLARAGEVPASISGENVLDALVYRDYARFVGERATLFSPEVQGEFAEAVTNSALFFEGQDLGTEVLAHLSPWLRLVARPVEFAPERRPEIPLPALAVIGVVDDAPAGETWITAFQTLLALLNVEHAQKGEPSMRLQLTSQDGCEISTARYPTPATGEGVDARYNLEPAVALAGRHLVLGTHVALVRELVHELARAEPRAAEKPREELQLDATGLGVFLQSNREAWIANEMLTKGKTGDAASSEFEVLRLALASFAGLRIEVDAHDPAAPEVRLALPFAR
jgi:hypothetical protein